LLTRTVETTTSSGIIWQSAIEIAEQLNIDVTPPYQVRGRRNLPDRLKDAIVLSTDGLEVWEGFPNTMTVYQGISFDVINCILSERHFEDSRDIILSIDACSPKSSRFFFKENGVSPLTQECGLECALSPQLEVVKSLVKRKQITGIESLLEELQPMQRCFVDVIKLLRAALTIPVAWRQLSAPSLLLNASSHT
jgi:hypothetical protein